MKDLLIADKADIAVVDDQPEYLEILVSLLGEDYNVHPFTRGDSLYRYIAAGRPVDLILLDVVMPVPDGHAVCRHLKELPKMEEVPIIFITALDKAEDEANGLALGAVDYITKPFSPAIVHARVAHHVRLGRALRLIVSQNDNLERRVTERTGELVRRNAELQDALHQVAVTQDATIIAISSLAETRDNETGSHIRRTQKYVRELALALRESGRYDQELDDSVIGLFHKSAPLHDIGKVAIPDQILLKPGRLDPDEFEIMKTHALHGSRVIEAVEAQLESQSSFLRHAREIAHFHHERWDGYGYPERLAGTDIPLSARLMAVADVYDALICHRVYKRAFNHQEAVDLIRREHGRQFDPQVTDAFLRIEKRFAAIATAVANEASADPDAGRSTE
jgi:putative two-component system response regulator